MLKYKIVVKLRECNSKILSFKMEFRWNKRKTDLKQIKFKLTLALAKIK